MAESTAALVEELKAMGKQEYEAGDIMLAADHWSIALDQDPTNVSLLSNRSLALTRLGRFVEAARDARRALQVEPGNSKLYFRLAAALKGMGAVAEALRVLDQGEALTGEKAAYAKLREECQRRLDQLDILAGVTSEMFEQVEDMSRKRKEDMDAARLASGMAVVATDDDAAATAASAAAAPAAGAGAGGVAAVRRLAAKSRFARPSLVFGEEEARAVLRELGEFKAAATAAAAAAAGPGLEERMAFAEAAESAANVLIASEHYEEAKKALDRGLSALNVTKGATAEQRAVLETRKLPLYAARSFAAICLGDGDTAESDALRVQARVEQTRMRSGYVLAGGRKRDWNRQVEEIATFRAVVAQALSGDVKAAKKEAARLARLRPFDAVARRAHRLIRFLRRESRADDAEEEDEEEGNEDDEDEEEEGAEDGEADGGEGEGAGDTEDDMLTEVAAQSGDASCSVQVLVLMDTSFTLANRIWEVYISNALSGVLDGAVRIRRADFSAWKHIDWSRERYVVLLASPLHAPVRDVEYDGNHYMGLMRWLALARPPLGHLHVAVCGVGHSEYFPGFEETARHATVLLGALGASALIPSGFAVVDTAGGRQALTGEAASFSKQVAEAVHELSKRPTCPDEQVHAPYFDPVSVTTNGGRTSALSDRLRLRPAHVVGVRRGAEGSTGLAELTLRTNGSDLPHALQPDDGIGVLVPNSPALVDAFLRATGVAGDMDVPRPTWAYSRVVGPDWREDVQDRLPETVVTAQPRVAPTLLEHDAFGAAGLGEPLSDLHAVPEGVEGLRMAREVVDKAARAVAEAERGLPAPMIRTSHEAAQRRLRTLPPANTARVPVVRLREALLTLFDLRVCSGVLLEQLKLLAPERAAFDARAAELPHDWKQRFSVPDLLSFFPDSAQPPSLRGPIAARRRVTWSARSHLAAILSAMTSLTVTIVPVSEPSPADVAIAGPPRELWADAAAGGLLVAAADDATDAALQGRSVTVVLPYLPPGAPVLIYRHGGVAASDPVDPTVPYAVIASGVGLGLARALAFRRLAEQRGAGAGRFVFVTVLREGDGPVAPFQAQMDALVADSRLQHFVLPPAARLRDAFLRPGDAAAAAATAAVQQVLLHKLGVVTVACESRTVDLPNAVEALNALASDEHDAAAPAAAAAAAAPAATAATAAFQARSRGSRLVQAKREAGLIQFTLH